MKQSCFPFLFEVPKLQLLFYALVVAAVAAAPGAVALLNWSQTVHDIHIRWVSANSPPTIHASFSLPDTVAVATGKHIHIHQQQQQIRTCIYSDVPSGFLFSSRHSSGSKHICTHQQITNVSTTQYLMWLVALCLSYNIESFLNQSLCKKTM